MKIHLEREIHDAIEEARLAGVLIFRDASAGILRHFGKTPDPELKALIERRILSEARQRGIPVLFAPSSGSAPSTRQELAS
ncbi:hypothetical protein [Jiella marina]|uniref:hypothetical protein n=1 Tax=Jiella sp. LLJ827 TaxID=2917712 RepID=UPI00210143A0|nr:hypothetical protein [Jiella sp. LLJ827]MCQ0986174.1 hypothetical protein [Jiella sp. LLJ827]